MRNVVGLRTVVEALFLIAVPVVALAAGVGWVGIVIASACAYGVVLIVEGVLARAGTPPAAAEQRRAAPPVQDHVRVLRTEQGPGAAPEEGAAPGPGAGAAPGPEAEAAPEPQREAAAPEPAPEPALEPDAWPSQPSNTVLLTETEPAPPGREGEAAPGLEREPAPEAAAAAWTPPPEPERDRWPEPALAAVPDLPPEPEPAPEVAPEPSAPVVQISAYGPPRQWNVWELERIARERAGDNAEKDEERTYLLMYLREFADADGMLPVDFDGLVRDSFGELVFA